MLDTSMLIPSLEKLYASVTILAIRSRLAWTAFSGRRANDHGEIETVFKTLDVRLSELSAALVSALRTLNAEPPASYQDLEALSSYRPTQGQCPADILTDLRDGHEQLIADIGFLRSVMTDEEKGVLQGLLSQINETSAVLSVTLETWLEGATPAQDDPIH